MAEGTASLSAGVEVMIQGFNWESAHGQDAYWYRFLKDKVGHLRWLGVGAIWLPPPSDSVSLEGYLPRKLERLDSHYGSADELKSLTGALHEAGIRVLVDCVLNHRCADQQGSEGKWNTFSGDYSWGPWAICSGNADFGGTGGPKEGEIFAAAPNLDHNNPGVKEGLIRWLKWLQSEVGADGWRFDFVKGYAGRHVGDYVRATNPAMAVGEFWDSCSYSDTDLLKNQDKHRQRTINWIDSTGGCSSAFDFTTKAILQEALQKREYWRLRDEDGSPPGVLGWWPAHAVPFLDNHDTGSTQRHWPFPEEHLREGYCYILTHPGVPCVFIDHTLEAHHDSQGHGLPDLIRQLIALRKQHGISATCLVDISEASERCYAAIVDGKVAVKLGGGDWQPSDAKPETTWNLEASGPEYAVWTVK